MTYRNDHDATLARAEALQAELARSERDRDCLAAELAAARAQRPAAIPESPRRRSVDDGDQRKQQASPQVRRQSWRKHLEITVVMLLSMAPFVCLVTCLGAADRNSIERAEQRDHAARWQALVGLEPCIRATTREAAAIRQLAPDQLDRGVAAPSRTATRCLKAARTLAGDDSIDGQTRVVLTRWTKAEEAIDPHLAQLADYIAHRDWEEDDLRGARTIWKRLAPALDARDIAVSAVTGRAVSPIRAAMRAIQRHHAQQRGRDETWWRIELGLALYEKPTELPPQLGGAPPALRDSVRELVARGELEHGDLGVIAHRLIEPWTWIPERR